MQLVFLHGLESGPQGAKYQALKKHFGTVLSPDCSGVVDPQQRLAIILDNLAAEPGPFLLIGSSMGGLMALLLQRVIPQRIAGMLLCAPALHRPAGEDLSAQGQPPSLVIHGRQDAVVPIETSRNFGLPLIEVNDDHSLRASLPVIIAETEKLKQKLEQE